MSFTEGLRRDNGGVGCFCGTDGYSGTDVSRTYTHACMRIYLIKNCSSVPIFTFYTFMNDFLSYNTIRGEILKTIIDN